MRDEVDFYLWLQWLAYSQFAACWQTSQGFAMPIGLYRDLAVGVAEGGAETWCDRELYCLKASVARRRIFLVRSELGLPPMDPHIITARAYEPFIDLLRANMQNCGALRIDHVMSCCVCGGSRTVKRPITARTCSIRSTICCRSWRWRVNVISAW
jgi:4-alpha-glucanotransferase